MTTYTLVPITHAEGKQFIALHHRHNVPPITWKFGVGIADAEGVLVGVGLAGLPKARMLMDGTTVEVIRTCTLGAENGNSILYGALCRAAKALGYRKVITYTLATEHGSSLKASGFTAVAEVPASKGWSRPTGRAYIETDLFGKRASPPEAKVRWERVVA